MTGSKLFFRLFSFFFFTQFFLVLPFQYALLPDFNSLLDPLISSVLGISVNLFGLNDMAFSQVIYSDSSGHYLFTFFLLLFTALITGLLLILVNKDFWTEKLLDAMQTILAFCLSFYLFKYGLDKVLYNQFYPPGELDLYSVMAFRTKDILYWNLMGLSKSYIAFSGWIEIVPAVLLWFRRTRGIGALISVFVMLNVTAINFGFDISVKLFSMALLSLSIILSLNLIVAVTKSISYKLPVVYYEHSAMPLFKSPWLYALLKTSAILFIIVECSVPFLVKGFKSSESMPSNELQGVWSLEAIANSVANTSVDLPFEFLILGKGKEAFLLKNGLKTNMDYKFNSSQLSLENEQKTFRFNLNKIGENDLTLTDTFKLKSSLKLKRMPLKNLPVQAQDFHWTLDAQLQKMHELK